MGAAVLISSGIARIVMYVLCGTHGQRGGDGRLFGCCFAHGLHSARGSIYFPVSTCSSVGGVCGHTAAVVRDAALAVAWRELRDPRGVPTRDVSLRCQPPVCPLSAATCASIPLACFSYVVFKSRLRRGRGARLSSSRARALVIQLW